MWAYLGSAARSAEQIVRGEGPRATTAEQILFWGGLVVTAISVALITRYTKRTLRRELVIDPIAR
jgi:hypothetical protein